MLQYAFACFISKVQARKICVLRFQNINHTQRLQVVLKSAKVSHAGIERILPRVSERCMSQVVGEANSLCQRLIQSQHTSR